MRLSQIAMFQIKRNVGAIRKTEVTPDPCGVLLCGIKFVSQKPHSNFV